MKAENGCPCTGSKGIGVRTYCRATASAGIGIERMARWGARAAGVRITRSTSAGYAGHRPLVNGFGFLFVRSTFLESSREGGAFRKQPPSRHGCTGQKKSAMGTREAAAPRPDVFSPSASAIVRRMLASSYVLLKLAGSPAMDLYASLLRALTTTVST